MSEKKLIDIFILEILNQYSSVHKRMTIVEIQKYLEKEYNISVHRNTLSVYIKELRYYGYIEGERGVYLRRKFTNIEMKTLMDGIMFSKAIPEEDIYHIIEKLKSMSDPIVRKKYKNIYFATDIFHTENKNVCKNIDLINEAIEKNKKIEITSCNYNEKRELIEKGSKVVDPYYVVLEKARYYLICYSGRQNDVEPRRIDRIYNVKVLKERRMNINKIEKYSKNPFSIADYMREHIYMYSGETERITLKIKNEHIGDVIDWYGKDFLVVEKDEEQIIIKIRANINAVYFWALQYGSIVEILEPECLRNKIREGLENILEKYKKT